jgi:hypothetical protein
MRQCDVDYSAVILLLVMLVQQISCDALDKRTRTNYTTERGLNTETFGATSVAFTGNNRYKLYNSCSVTAYDSVQRAQYCIRSSNYSLAPLQFMVVLNKFSTSLALATLWSCSVLCSL